MTGRAKVLLLSVLVVVSFLAIALSNQEPLTEGEEAFCVLMSADRLDTFGDKEVTELSPEEFEKAQLAQTQVFLDAQEVAPTELESALGWIAGQYAAINAVYQDIDWDLSRTSDIDPELMSNVAVNYPEETAARMLDNIDKWTKRHC